jgi:hypothetical protein
MPTQWTSFGFDSKNKRLNTNSSSRYSDDEYEYRHVQLPKNMLKAIPKEYHDPSKGTLKLLWEEEWRALGITQVRRTYPHQFKQACILINNRVLDGSITKFMSQNHIYFFSSRHVSIYGLSID